MLGVRCEVLGVGCRVWGVSVGEFVWGDLNRFRGGGLLHLDHLHLLLLAATETQSEISAFRPVHTNRLENGGLKHREGLAS